MNFYQQGGFYTDPMETMYPKIYYKVYPHITARTDRFFYENGPYYNPSHEYIGDMVGEILEGIQFNDDDFDMDEYSRQLSTKGLLNTLVTILLLRELVGRRRRFPGYYY